MMKRKQQDTKTEEGVTSNSNESAQSSSETRNTGVETTEQAKTTDNRREGN